MRAIRIKPMLLVMCTIALSFLATGCGQNAVVRKTLYAISGQVKDNNGAGVAGVLISFGGSTSTVTTDANGNWTKTDLSGTVTVTPTKSNWTFNPASRQVTQATSAVNFTGTAQSNTETTFTVSGRVTNPSTNAGVPGVTITFSSTNDTVTTDNDGRWSKAGIASFVAIKPILNGWTFSPTSKVVDATTSTYDFTATPLAPSATSKIAYEYNGHIWVVNPDSTNNHDLGTGRGPQWLLDGRLLYEDNGTMWAMNADGGNRKQISVPVLNGVNLTWSPDGSKVVYLQSDSTRHYDIYIANADGSGTPARLTQTTALSEWGMTVSKDNKIAYIRDDTIWVMNSDGSENRSLGVYGRSLAWSPDGKKIALCATSSPFARGWDVFVVNADGSGKVQVTKGYSGDEPTWSPDGNRIAFISEYTDIYELYVVNVDGTNPAQLVTGSGRHAPAWSPVL